VRLNSALFSTAPNVSAPLSPRAERTGGSAPRPATAALKRSVHQLSNYSTAQVIFKGGM